MQRADPFSPVQYIDYPDELWTLKDYHPALADLLESRDRLLCMTFGRPPYAVVLGVPHHASVTEDIICEDRLDQDGRPAPRDADKNAASYALVAFTALRDRGVPCRLIIMAHPTTHDPNKEPASPYFRTLFAEPMRLLVECHAAGPQRRLSLEISAGPNRRADAPGFAHELVQWLGRRYTWGVQRRPGEKAAWIFDACGEKREGELELSALQTLSLMEADRRGIPAVHIEAKPAFCKPAEGRNAVTPDGLLLGRALAHAIISYVADMDGRPET